MQARALITLARAVLIAGALAFAAISATMAEERPTITILTSFPPSFYEPFRAAFEARRPDCRLRILNRKTSAAVAFVQEPRRERADAVWASSPDAFELLAAQGHLRAIGRPQELSVATIGKYPIDDVEGRYLGFALSGYGLVLNEDYLRRESVPAPVRLEDLRAPSYREHLGISSPSRSGTTHLMVEALLQRQGWEEGWATWMEIGGNLATITARSFGVVEGVARGRFGIGLSVDFLGRAAGAEERHASIRFVYPIGNVFLPASVGILTDAPNSQGAAAFVDFLMSDEGQRLLLDPAILRLPIDPALYGRQDSAFNPFAASADSQGSLLFDANLSSRRYELVNLLFDGLITYRLVPLKKAWRAIHHAEGLLEGHHDSRAAELLREARTRATRVPVSARQAADSEFNAGLLRRPRGVPVARRQADLETEWRRSVEANLLAATALAEEAERLLTGPAGEF